MGSAILPEYRLIITEYCNVPEEELSAFAEVRSAAGEEKVISLYNEKAADVVILGYGKGHEKAVDTAVYIAEHSAAAVLLLFSADAPASVIRRCAQAGVLFSHSNALPLMIPSLIGLRTRLISFESQTTTLQKKLDDTKLVTRAKMLLMSRLKMSESEAHRYIEKTAMDTSMKRREVAESIIRTYEE